MDGFRSVIPADAELFIEYLDAKRIPIAVTESLLVQTFRLKYAETHFDAIYVLDDDAFQFILHYHQELFPGTPVVFSGVNRYDPIELEGHPDITGVVETIDIEETIRLALTLKPDARSMLVITDRTTSGQMNRERIENYANTGDLSIPLKFMDSGAGLSLQELLEQLRAAESPCVVYYADFFQDRTGEVLNPENVMALVSDSAPGPVFVHGDMYLGHGAIGGKVNSGFYQGQIAGEILLRILSGEKPAAIPVLQEGSNRLVLDDRQVRRWKINPASLPDGVDLVNRPFSPLAPYFPVVIGGFIFLVVQGFIIAYLILTNRRRRTMERQLRESEERLKFALAGSNDALWDWHIDTGEIVFSPRFLEMLGYQPDEVAPNIHGWRSLLHPDEIPDIERAIKSHRDGMNTGYHLEHRFRTRAGEWKWVLARGKLVETDRAGQPLRMVGTYSDITDRHQVDEIVRSLLKVTAVSSRGEFYRLLVLNLAESLGMKCVLIGKLVGQDLRSIQTISVCLNGELVENFTYPLEGAPCSEVISTRSACSYRDGVQEIFPDDIVLADLQARGYVGAPLISGDGKLLGLVLAISEQPLENPNRARDLLEIFAGIIAGELERGTVTKALHESEALWHFALEGTGDGVWDWNLTNGEVFYSRTYKQMLGYRDAEFPNRLESWMTNVHPEDLGYVMSEHERHIQGETDTIDVEYRLKSKDGYYKWILARGKIVDRNSEGTATRLVGTHTDITLRKASEQVLHDMMAKYQSLFSSMSEGFAFHQIVFDERETPVDYVVLDVNPAYTSIMNIPRERAIGTRASQLYGLVPPQYLDLFSRVAVTGVSERQELFIEPLQKYFDVAVFSPEQGRFATVFTDVTGRKQAESILARERNLLRTVVDNIPDAISVKDHLYRRTLSNKADLALIGARSELDVLGKTDYEFWPADLAAVFHEQDRYVFETGLPIVNREIAYQSPGTKLLRWVVVSRIPLFSPEGKVMGLVGIGREVTERKQSEQEIRRLNAELEERVHERTAQLEAAMKELEAFSYSVSHDLRAPLRSIEGFSLALSEDYSTQLDEAGVNYLHRIRASSRRMSDLIDDMLKLSRITRSTLRKEPVDLSAISAVIAAEIQATMPDRVVDWRISPGLVVNADASLMRIVLENLLGNAWKFTGKHDRAKIELGQAEIDGTVVYYLRDDGSGFDMKYAQNLFAPFQRMHNSSEFEGTGIGLATVQRVILLHGGSVWVESEVDQGTTVYFTLG